MNVASQFIDNTGHIVTGGEEVPVGKSRDSSVYLEVEYAVSDRLTVSAGIPYVFARYIGPNPPPGPGTAVDLCHCWHSAWQDVGATARFNVSNGRLGLTPFLAVGVPSHDYSFRGEAVVGRGLREMRVGVDAGRRLDAVSSKLSVEGRYSYAIVQRVLDIPNNRSNATLGAALSVTDALAVKGLVSWQRTHGGLRTMGPPPQNSTGYPWGEIVTADLFSQHDRLLRDNSLHAGVSASYSLRQFDIFGSYIGFLSGSDTHAGRAFTAGVSWPFVRTRGSRQGPTTPASGGRSN